MAHKSNMTEELLIKPFLGHLELDRLQASTNIKEGKYVKHFGDTD